MGNVRSIFLCISLTMTSCASPWVEPVARNPVSIEIDGVSWNIVRSSKTCESRIAAARAAYWRAPIYRKERSLLFNRYYVSATTDCWVEFDVSGVTEFSFAFRVNKEGEVLDRKLVSSWLPKIRAYPKQPYE